MAMLDGGALTHRAAAADSGGAVGSVENRLFNTALAHLQQQVPPLAMAHSGGASVAPEQTQLALTTLSRLFQSVLSDAAPNSPGLARPFQRAFVRHATDHAGADVAAQALTQALPHLQYVDPAACLFDVLTQLFQAHAHTHCRRRACQYWRPRNPESARLPRNPLPIPAHWYYPP